MMLVLLITCCLFGVASSQTCQQFVSCSQTSATSLDKCIAAHNTQLAATQSQCDKLNCAKNDSNVWVDALTKMEEDYDDDSYAEGDYSNNNGNDDDNDEGYEGDDEGDSGYDDYEDEEWMEECWVAEECFDEYTTQETVVGCAPFKHCLNCVMNEKSPVQFPGKNGQLTFGQQFTAMMNDDEELEKNPSCIAEWGENKRRRRSAIPLKKKK